MRHQDWQAHQSLLHRHGNIKFARPTPRTEHESPVFESFGDAHPLEGICIVVGCAAILAIIVIGLTWGWI
jgi:hypothetical protein